MATQRYVDARGDRLRPESAEFRNRCSDRCVVEAGGERSAAVSCSLVDWEVCWIVVACRACVLKPRGETQEEHLRNLILTITDVDDDGASCVPTSTRTVQSASSSCCTSLATAQVRKDTPSLIDVNGLGRPKEFSGKEDFQQWSKKTEAFFAGVIKESEMMLEWSAEQVTEITTELIDLEGARSRKPGVCAAADAYSAYGSDELRGE